MLELGFLIGVVDECRLVSWSRWQRRHGRSFVEADIIILGVRVDMLTEL